jgi:hypothetical protein
MPLPERAMPMKSQIFVSGTTFKLLMYGPLVIAALLTGGQVRAMQFITNGGFELPVGYYVATTSLPGWYVSENVDVISLSGGGWPAYEGDQSLDLAGCVTAGAYIEQAFPTVPGQRYHLSFWYGNNIWGSISSGWVRVRGSATLIEELLNHSGSTQSDMNYTHFERDFTADSLSTTLRFTHPFTDCNGLALDEVEVTDSTPYIRGQPRSQVGYWGKSVTFNVTVYGWSPLNYQWIKDGAPVVGATDSSLVLTNLQTSNAGAYSLVVTNAYGSVTSNPAILTVNPAGVSLALYAGVTIDGVVNQTYGIQSTSDLSNTNSWAGVTNITLTVPTQLWFDMQPASQPQRYYRVVPGPILIP